MPAAMSYPLKMIEAAKLKPYERNARTHPQEQIDQIKALIRMAGFVGPILYDHEADHVIAGHGRLIAAQQMIEAGEEIPGPGRRSALPKGKLPVIDGSGMSEAERRAFVIADNQVAARSGWDAELLGFELQALDGLGFPMALLAFETTELRAFMPGPPAQSDPDKIPPPPPIPVAQLGDLWALGEHLLICGDCTDSAVVARVLPSIEGAMAFTDPPYGIGFEYASHDDSSNAANADLVARAFALAPRAKAWTPGANNLARDISRFGVAKVAAWWKRFAAAGNGIGGAATWEPVLIVDPLARRLANDHLDIPTDRAEVEGKPLVEHHPCPKPVKLYVDLIEALTDPEHAVYEPFSGSGTTLIAGQITGRSVRAVEIDPAYVDVAIKRWQEFTGRQAILMHANGDRSTFAEIAGERGIA